MRPDFGAVTNTDQIAHLIGGLLTVALITAIGVLIVAAVTWAIATGTGAWQTATRARTGVLVALAGATLTGAALAWTNWLLNTGAAL
ncbi:DUF6112 family protein [Xylanimonas protaetiae]|uniref:Uncharacterized protein n=1 Tax=Xylanimonas protaetiae TaxID=2509457 RepID=A0A4P6F6E7_9MICO|nr:DUF6112 family protein [Xylanimonas protaetiae]QAY68777.1 hypothetical protein ET471_00870 [Xylanimonas protaetiae]